MKCQSHYTNALQLQNQGCSQLSWSIHYKALVHPIGYVRYQLQEMVIGNTNPKTKECVDEISLACDAMDLQSNVKWKWCFLARVVANCTKRVCSSSVFHIVEH